MGGAPPPGLAEREPTPPSPTLQPFCTFFPTQPPTAPHADPALLPPPTRSSGRADRPYRSASTCACRGPDRVPSASGSRAPVPASWKANLRFDAPPVPQRRSAISALSSRACRRGAGAAGARARADGLRSSNKSSGTSADPATVIPASTPVYLAAEVRPRGPLKEATLDCRAQADRPQRTLRRPAGGAPDARLAAPGLRAATSSPGSAATGRSSSARCMAPTRSGRSCSPAGSTCPSRSRTAGLREPSCSTRATPPPPAAS